MNFNGLVACRAGMGSSLMLKIKVQQVINENKLPIIIEHGSIDSLVGYKGDLLITLSDVAKEVSGSKNNIYIIGINNIIDKIEIYEKLRIFLKQYEKEI